MKKVLYFMLVVILIVSCFASCNPKKEESTTAEPVSESETTNIAATSEVEATDTVETTDVVTEEPVSETTEEDTTDAPVTEE